VDRIQGEVKPSGKSQSYVIPPSFEIAELEPAIETPLAVLQVRPGAGYQLRRMATTIETADDWDLLEVPIFDLAFITSLVLWHGEDVIVSSPLQLRSAVITGLEKVVSTHG
jgi:predicted DNA-binding transcriptional regulator YafY